MKRKKIIKKHRKISEDYGELQILFSKAYNEAKRKNDKITLGKLNNYSKVIANKISEYKKDHRKANEFSKAIKQGILSLESILSKGKKEHRKKSLEKGKKEEKIKKREEKREKRKEKRRTEKGRIPLLQQLNLKKTLPINFGIGIVIGILVFIINRGILNSIIFTFAVFILLTLSLFLKIKLKESQKVKKMEFVFPDFLQLMASNLRAGMTIDRSLLLSARKEFAPLDKEIIRLGKDIVTGKKIEESLEEMSKRIKSDKLDKIITLIISGIRSGGNLAILLEETSSNMRERNFLEKRSASNVLMYVIFIFFATAAGAPILFALSSVLVEVLASILSTIPDLGGATSGTSISLPFTITKINIPVAFVFWFTLSFLIVLDILGSFVLGLVNKGEEKEGVKYIIPLIAISVVVFFTVRILLLNYFSGFIT